jgi:hypothetical protein
MAKQRMRVPKFDTSEKELFIGTDDITLEIDFDDVNHPVVEELTKLIVEKLNDIPEKEWKAAVEKGRKRALSE